MSSVYQAFVSTAQRAADHAFLHIPASASSGYTPDAPDFTYAEMLAAVDTCAEKYCRRGYCGPLRLALMLENQAEFFIHWFALNKLGCSVVPISSESQTDEVEYFLEHSEAVAVICLDNLLENVLKGLPCKVPKSGPALTSLPSRTGEPTTQITANTECALLYTSGSTGKPKACILNNEYFTFAGQWYYQLGGLAELVWGQERLLTPLPLTHMNAMAVSTMAMIASAGCLIQLDRFHPQTWWQTVRDSAATAVHYLGVLPAILLELPETDEDNFQGQIKFGFGAGVNPGQHAKFEKRFGFPLLEAWAMTESGVGGSIIANHEPRHVGTSCFGKVPDYLEYQLIDECGQPVATGMNGELRVRAKGENTARGFFSGYLKNTEATAEIWLDGWLNTGDVVREDSQGNLYFVDRRKNVIRRSGENISALEVEACLGQYQPIGEVVVCAVADDLRGDEVAACVVCESNSEDIARAIVQYALARLAYFKAPGYVIFCDELPKTASNKPRRGEIKILAKDRVENGTCFDTRAMKKRLKAG